MKKSVKISIITGIVAVIILVATIVPVVLLSSDSSEILPENTTTMTTTMTTTRITTSKPPSPTCLYSSYNNSGRISVSQSLPLYTSICIHLNGPVGTTMDLAFGYIDLDDSMQLDVYDSLDGNLLFHGDNSLNGFISPIIHSSKNSMYIVVNNSDTSGSHDYLRLAARFLSINSSSEPPSAQGCGGYVNVKNTNNFCLWTNSSTDCRWYIEQDYGLTIVNSDPLHLDDNESIAIYEGWSIDGNHQIKNFTGNQSITDQWISSTNMTLHYRRSSDPKNLPFRGGSPPCVKLRTISSKYLMTTPYGGFSNEDFSDCYISSGEDWLIRVNRTKIILSIHYFEHDHYCPRTMKVYDGPSVDSPLLAVFYGSTVLSSIMSSGNEMRIQYRNGNPTLSSRNSSRQSNFNLGFKASYSSL